MLRYQSVSYNMKSVPYKLVSFMLTEHKPWAVQLFVSSLIRRFGKLFSGLKGGVVLFAIGIIIGKYTKLW
jgi:hypothetical protein